MDNLSSYNEIENMLRILVAFNMKIINIMYLHKLLSRKNDFLVDWEATDD